MINAVDTESVPPSRLEEAGLYAMFGMAGALQFSIALAQILLAGAAVCWVALLISRRERVAAPAMFWPLAVYAGLTLVSAALSADPRASLIDCKQLVLFLIVPMVYRFVDARGGPRMITVIVTFGAASAVVGIVQYGILNYDNLGQRPQGTLGHYMTYSGLLMLVMTAALARLLFGRRERTWSALVMPALAVAVALTFTRSAWVGACLATALLLSLKDFRLLAALPIVAAVFFAAAPTAVTARFISMFDLKDPTNRDRVAMLREGEHMVRAHPLVGVGPNMVEVEYVEYRDAAAGGQVNPHLHNVPVQIAAERGLPALAVWTWFIVAVIAGLARRFYAGTETLRFLSAGGLAAVTAMLGAGLFEYNFGDSEFLMLFLVLVTLPFALGRPVAARRPA